MNQLQKDLSRPITCKRLTHSSREKLIINREFGRTLASADLTSFDKVWDYTEGEMIKSKNNRSVSRIDLKYFLPENRDGTPEVGTNLRSFFLKKHSEPLGLTGKTDLWKISEKLQGEGLREFNNYCDFRNKGLATATPVAGGMRRTGSTLRSFLITMDFSPLYALEDIILRHPEKLESPINQEKRKNILAAIARYARHMHKHAINQKDFNATHILVNDIDSPDPVIALFDLQHVDRKIINRFRWPIKALAELNVSLPRSIFSEQDRFFLFCSYKGKTHLDLIDRFRYKCVVKKTEKIRRHTLKNNLAPKSNSLEQ
ncbi:MAG: lipopolysaccharide kinase InaA family protein [Desulfurivibrionaceae bacterium]